MKIVFSYGGSILAPETTDETLTSKVALMLKKLAENHEICVVVGGGHPAREAIAKARSAGKSESYCDYIGILATRENAKLMKRILGDNTISSIPESIFEAANKFGEKILVMGGTEPGHSTDAVAALIADWINADLLVKASNIAYIYDKNPKKEKDAKPIEKMSPEKLVSMVSKMASGAGQYELFDLVAAKVIERCGVKTLVLDGRDLENIKAAINGREFSGTTIE